LLILKRKKMEKITVNYKKLTAEELTAAILETVGRQDHPAAVIITAVIKQQFKIRGEK